jgi:hypothetical protein
MEDVMSYTDLIRGGGARPRDGLDLGEPLEIQKGSSSIRSADPEGHDLGISGDAGQRPNPEEHPLVGRGSQPMDAVAFEAAPIPTAVSSEVVGATAPVSAEVTVSPEVREMLAAAGLDAIMENAAFQSCTPVQQLCIAIYARQMVDGGDRAEFAVAVGIDMASLYQGGVDKKLPRELPEKLPIGSSTRTPEEMAIRRERSNAIISAIGALRSAMEERGLDYATIDHYYNRQMASSGSQASQAMRYCLLTQRQDSGNIDNNYYLGFYNEEVKFTESDLKAKFEKVCQKCCDGDQEKYARTVAMHRAFTAIALNEINFPGKHSGTCTVFRVMRDDSREADFESDQKKTVDMTLMQHNVAESTSIKEPWDMACFDSSTYEFEVPFARVSAAYFLHSFDCEGKYVADPGKFWIQRELVCNLNGLPVKVMQND